MRRFKWSITIILIAIIIISSSLVLPRLLNPKTKLQTQSIPGCTDPSNEVSGITCSWLAQEASAWKPINGNVSIGWSIQFNSASYDNLENTPQSAIQDDLNMLLQSGASCVRIDVGYDAWLLGNLTAQNELSGFVNQIRSAGKCLIIADASSEYYRQHPLTWSQYMQAWPGRVETLAGKYHPDFYIVIKEPGWYVPMVSDSKTNPQFQNSTVWTDLAQTLANAVLSVSPSTKVGISISSGASNQQFYVNFLKGVSAVSNITFIGYDIYGSNDFANTLYYISQVGSTKHIWIAEAWSTDTPSIVFSQDRASLDAYWIQVLYYFAIHIGATNVIPFYTDAFASYTQPANYGSRTQVFAEFQHLASTYNGAVR